MTGVVAISSSSQHWQTVPKLTERQPTELKLFKKIITIVFVFIELWSFLNCNLPDVTPVNKLKKIIVTKCTAMHTGGDYR